ncbi:fimbrial protein [Pseudomonas nabeulensis]|uniref:fimbrial protein n=1 Tax=Pseudomonas nabeulensis TaxID=2293833 RepID=UPI001EE99BB3|nr:fimbrial protein [Pseudomonas nabeulensis]
MTSGTVPAGYFIERKWLKSSNTFRLQLGSPVRFIRPIVTCDLAAGDINRIIVLPSVGVSDFNNAISAGAHNFELSANCSNATNVTFRIAGTPAPGSPEFFANTGSAGGVALRLYSRINGVPATISNNGTRTLAVSGNRAVLPLGAAYHKNGTVRQGTLVSTATVNITYN